MGLDVRESCTYADICRTAAHFPDSTIMATFTGTRYCGGGTSGQWRAYHGFEV